MKINRFLIAILALAASLTACKNDKESDLTPDKSALDGLYINEVYSSNPDWVELYNDTDKEIDISGFALQDDKGAAEEYVLPQGTKIAPKSYLVLDAFGFGLSSSKGDQVKLLDKSAAQVDEITLPIIEDGKSYGRKTDAATEWIVFDTPSKGISNGTKPEEPKTELKVYINEVMSAPDGDDVDFIEIYNGEEREINIGGYTLQDDKGAAEEFVVPADTKIPAKGFVVFSQVSPGAGVGFTFGLSSKGDKVILLNDKKEKQDEISTPNFGTDKGKSYGRVTDGGSEWKVFDLPTKGESNGATPVVGVMGNIVINEVYTYSPQNVVEDLDFIEIYNRSNAELDLSGLKMWESGGRAEAWDIPQGTKIAGKGRIVIECDKYTLHTDGKSRPIWGLSKGPDEYVVIALSDFSQVDSIKCPSMNANESYGRKTDGAAEWVIFQQFTKGTANMGAERQPVVNSMGLYINEIFTNNQKTQTAGADWDTTKDFIELYNSTDKPISLKGFSIYDDKHSEDEKYVCDTEVVPAKGYLVMEVYKGNTTGPVFGLGKSGDWVFIHDTDGDLVDSMEAPAFGNDDIHTVGRKTDGSSEIVVFTEPSKGKSNNGKNIKQ